jgi:GMP synthase (glutamine-hydrolysing)
MDFLVIENYPQTGLGVLGRVAAQEGYSWRYVRAYAGEAVPGAAGSHAGLVVLGGAQSALDDEDYPFLPSVCDLIRAFHAADRPVLGICLGAQLVARALGGANRLGLPVEFGWREVIPTAAGRGDPVVSQLGTGSPQFHWHTDTVSLPGGASHLATSDMTPVQAFRIGRATYGLQFHFETGLQEVRTWSETFAEDIASHTPDWNARLEAEVARHAETAEKAGSAISRAWLNLL